MSEVERNALKPIFGLTRLALVCLGLTGCATEALKLAPGSPSEPWSPGEASAPAIVPAEETAARGGEDFSVPADPLAARLQAPPQIVDGRRYDLPHLIDVAIRQNPQTRIAWQQARQAALAVGIAEATFLPTLSASVVGGAQEVIQPLPDNITGERSFTTTTTAIVPAVTLEWLLFDFGLRRANTEVARHNSFAANIAFNGMHQQVIYDVAVAYYRYGAVERREVAARQALANSRQIDDAATSRLDRGLGTSVEVAQADQQVAQSKLRLVEARGTRRSAYQSLLAAMGVSPLTELEVKTASRRSLPSGLDAPTAQVIEAALAQRPDVLSAFSRLKASEAGVRAAEAAFRPKVFLSAVASGGRGTFEVGGLPGLRQSATSAGVLVGVSIPIYSGGLRRAQREEARSVKEVAEQTFVQAQDAAAREIVVASDTLRTALAAYEAAQALVNAAEVTYDAAFSSYRSGVGTLTAATAANTGLLDAQEALADAHAAALVAATTLAFALGSLTSPAAATADALR